MIKVKKILSVLFALLFITSFKYNDKYAYESVNYIKFSDFNKKGISYSRVPLINKIKGVYYNNYFSIDNYFFPEDESFVIKKFSEDWYLEKKDFIYDGEVIKNIGGKDFEIDNKEIFSILFKNNNGFLVPAFTERYKEKGKDYFGTFLLGVSRRY